MAKKKATTAVFHWEGRRLPMELTPSGWRLRSRSRHFPIDYSTNILAIDAAKDDIRLHLEKVKAGKVRSRSKHTFGDLLALYQSLPKRAGAEAAYIAECRLKAILRTVHKKEPEEIPVSSDVELWMEYARIKRGGTLDLSHAGRRPDHKKINGAIRTAKSIFKKALIPRYRAEGFDIPAHLLEMQWLPEMKLPKPKVKASLLMAWRRLKKTNKAMWRTVGLARCAGLRRDEIENIRKDWLVVEKVTSLVPVEDADDKETVTMKKVVSTVVRVQLCDRPEENYTHKTGEPYKALIISPALAKDLLSADEGLLVQPNLNEGKKPISRHRWFERWPQRWLKSFTGTNRQPLHRLRSLYLENVAKRTKKERLATEAGIQAAADAGGHTTTRTTKKHYVDPRDL